MPRTRATTKRYSDKYLNITIAQASLIDELQPSVIVEKFCIIESSAINDLTRGRHPLSSEAKICKETQTEEKYFEDTCINISAARFADVLLRELDIVNHLTRVEQTHHQLCRHQLNINYTHVDKNVLVVNMGCDSGHTYHVMFPYCVVREQGETGVLRLKIIDSGE